MNKLSGILGKRISLTQQRLLRSECPRFTPEFILADVRSLDLTNRRFSAFSGDLSGRFLGALSLLPERNSFPLLHKLAREIVTAQGSDGRFGNMDLDFFGTEIDRSHMPLLWGNGRLLVGLLEYYSRFNDQKILQAATRLGDFLVKVLVSCLKPEQAEKLKSQGAWGFICCTQCNEGLAMLASFTGDNRYHNAAAEIAHWLLPRGKQHSHGYLTTLRGMMLLHEQSANSSLLKAVEKNFNELIESSDYLPQGGVPEYFGWKQDPLSIDPNVAQHSTSEVRDEGCSEADFLRLAIQLWQATGELSYLEKAEHCLFNHLLSNQFSNGDFGHRHLSTNGCKPYPSPGRAWWCCTMHGLRAFKDVQNVSVTRKETSCYVNFFLDTDFLDEELKVKFRHGYHRKLNRHLYTATILRISPKPFAFFFRNPEWVRSTTVRINGRKVAGASKAKFFHIKRKWKIGDRIELEHHYRVRFQTRDNKMRSLKEVITAKAEDSLALHYGPWMLAIQDSKDPLYFGEPAGNNFVHLPKSDEGFEGQWYQPSTDSSEGRLKLTYTHEGFSGSHQVFLRPVCQQVCCDNGTLDYFLRFRTD